LTVAGETSPAAAVSAIDNPARLTGISEAPFVVIIDAGEHAFEGWARFLESVRGLPGRSLRP